MRRSVLGQFLRAQRERLTAAEVGLPAGFRRRTPGLRREEVAQLSNISVTWYVWIEQGRDVSVSPLALSRLSVALRLTRPQWAYLSELAGRRDPEQFAPGSGTVSTTLQTCIDTVHAPPISSIGGGRRAPGTGRLNICSRAGWIQTTRTCCDSSSSIPAPKRSSTCGTNAHNGWWRSSAHMPDPISTNPRCRVSLPIWWRKARYSHSSGTSTMCSSEPAVSGRSIIQPTAFCVTINWPST